MPERLQGPKALAQAKAAGPGTRTSLMAAGPK